MDVKKANNKKSKSGLKTLVLTLVIISVTSWYLYSSSMPKVHHSEVVFSIVKGGVLNITVDGYGFLKSKKQKLITAQSQATVIEILLRPGQQVKKNSVILLLENFDLTSEQESTGLELKTEQSNLRELILNQQRELLQERSKYAELAAKYESIKYQRKATESLMVSGTVSKLDFVKLELEELQFKERVDFLAESLRQLGSLHKEAINIQNEKIKLKELKIKAINKKVSDLSVKAGQPGVIQKLPLELGQTLAKGQQIALIGDDKDLLASIQIPQSKIHMIAVGHPVIIDTRQDEIKGEVSRIEPGVIDNYVTIEVELPKNLPSSARPELSVDALITVLSIKKALYIDKPINIQENSFGSLFKYDEDSGIAQKTKLTFGAESSRFIEIKDGASNNDIFIISDLSKLTSGTIIIED